MPRGLDLLKSHRDPTCRQLLHHGSSPALVHAWILRTCRCSTTPSHLHLVVQDESRWWCRHQPGPVQMAPQGGCGQRRRSQRRRRRQGEEKLGGGAAMGTRCGGGLRWRRDAVAAAALRGRGDGGAGACG